MLVLHISRGYSQQLGWQETHTAQTETARTMMRIMDTLQASMASLPGIPRTGTCKQQWQWTCDWLPGVLGGTTDLGDRGRVDCAYALSFDRAVALWGYLDSQNSKKSTRYYLYLSLTEITLQHTQKKSSYTQLSGQWNTCQYVSSSRVIGIFPYDSFST